MTVERPAPFQLAHRKMAHRRSVRSRTHSYATVTAIAVPLMLGACGGNDGPTSSASAATAGGGSVSVSDAFTIKPVAGQPVAGVFANVQNTSDEPATIIAASSPVSDDVQLHQTVTDNDSMKMEQVDQFEIAPGETFAFERGGPHIMLMDIDPATYPDDTVEVTLELSDGTEVPFHAEVNELETATDQ